METSAFQEPSIKAPIDMLEQFERNSRPAAKELRAMMVSMMYQKGWNLKHLSLLTGIQMEKLSKLRNNPECALSINLSEQRALWMLWMIDVAPAALFDFMQIIHWGRWVAPIFDCVNFMDIPLDDRKNLILALESADKNGRRMTLREVASFSGVTIEAASELCRQSAYTVEPDTIIPDFVPKFMRPGWIWRELNWNRTNDELSKSTGISIESIDSHRVQLIRLHNDGLLEKVVKLVGADPERFRFFFQKTS